MNEAFSDVHGNGAETLGEDHPWFSLLFVDLDRKEGRKWMAPCDPSPTGKVM